MPPGATNFGDNRFALLGANPPLSPASKKKKRARSAFIEEFPELQSVIVEHPKFVVVSATENEKPLSSYSCFAVYRALQIISKEIISVAELRDGSLLLLVKSAAVATKFTNAKVLAGVCNVKCSLHEKLNITKGTIYAPYLNNVAEEEIVSELKSQGVVSVYKFTRNNEGVKSPNGVLLLDFDLYSLPAKIDISWHSVKVRQYIPTPMRCKNCQLLGHTAKFCKNPSSCSGCNLPPHAPVNCTRVYCANCAENHPADSKDCKKFKQQKEIITIKTQKKCSIREAQKIYQEQSSVPSSITSLNGNSFSAVLAHPPSSSKNITLQPPTQQLQTQPSKNNITQKNNTPLKYNIPSKNNIPPTENTYNPSHTTDLSNFSIIKNSDAGFSTASLLTSSSNNISDESDESFCSTQIGSIGATIRQSILTLNDNTYNE